MSKLGMKIRKPDFDMNWLLETEDGEWSLWQYNRYWQAEGRVYGFRNNRLEILVESDNMNTIVSMMKNKISWLVKQCKKLLINMDGVDDVGIEFDMEDFRTGNANRLMKMFQHHEDIDNDELVDFDDFDFDEK